MFVDNPVGTGYSYVDSLANLTTNNDQIATDLVALVKEVFTSHSDMQKMPFFVFCESYGGKMAVDFAIAFDKAIKNGEVVSDFRGVALGDSWISPMDYVNTWGTFLYQMGFVNRAGQAEIDASAALAQAAVDSEKWVQATDQWGATESVVDVVAHGVNFYNVLAVEDIYKTQSHSSDHNDLSFMTPAIRRLYDNHVGRLHRNRVGDPLTDFMNGPQKAHWAIPDSVTWDSQGGYVFDRLAEDFMKPVVDSVVKLLTETDLKVNVFNGNLDLICDTPGTYRWIENMEWPDKINFMEAGTKPIYISSYSSPAALVQSSGNFSLYTIFRSGHMVPVDVPEMGLKLVDTILAAAAATHQHLPPSKKEPTKLKVQEKEPSKRQGDKQKGIPLSAVNSQRSRVVATHLNPATPTGKRFGKLGPTFHGPRRGLHKV
nr:retinoid-inducible serine carboxypeptidase-like [Procambarus clarkii]